MSKKTVTVDTTIQEQFNEYIDANPIYEPTAVSKNVYDIYTNMKEGKIMKPNFQRNFRWDVEKQSRLIQSLILGFTPPCLFAFYENDENDLEVLRFHDGLQRSSTIFDFFENKLTLKGLDKLEFLNGLKYKELPLKIQNHLQNRNVSVLQFPPGTPRWVVQEHFNLLNTNGEPLSMGETFRGTYYGKYYQIMHALGNNVTFQAAMGNKGKGKCKDALEHEKYVEYWAAMFHNKIWTPRTTEIEYVNSPLSSGKKYIEKNLMYWSKNEDAITTEFVENITKHFVNAVNLSVEIFGDLPFRKPKIDWNCEVPHFIYNDGEIAMNNTNNGMFECFMYLMTFAEAESVKKNAKKIKTEFFNGLLANHEVYETFHNMCLNGKAAKTRFRFVYDLLIKCGVTFTNL